MFVAKYKTQFNNRKNGVCSACNNFSKKKYKLEKREKEFKKIVKKIKSKKLRYDCIVPVSGGKDSTWQTIKCLEYGLIHCNLRSPQRTKIGQENLNNLISLGVDHIDWSVNPEIEEVNFRKFKIWSNCNTYALAMFNIPVLIASYFKIPYIIWGENSAVEYGNISSKDNQKNLSKNWYKKYGVTHNTRAIDWVSKNLPKNKMSTTLIIVLMEQTALIRSIFLGYFFKWDPLKTYKIAKKRVLKHLKLLELVSINLQISTIISYLFITGLNGINLVLQEYLISIEIRNRRISKAKAIKIVKADGLKPPLKILRNFVNTAISQIKNFLLLQKHLEIKKFGVKIKIINII